MEVRILGSGGSEGIPAFLCKCRVCAEARLRGMDPKSEYPPEGRQGPFVEFLPIEAYRPITLGSCRVTPLETNHMRSHGYGNGDGSETFGYLFEDSDGTRMAYMVDAQSDLPARTVEILSEARLDCLIFECTFEHLDPPIGHTDIRSLIRIGQSFSPRALIATHISHQNLGHRDLVDALAGEGIRVAYDGMRFKVRPRHGRAPASR